MNYGAGTWPRDMPYLVCKETPAFDRTMTVQSNKPEDIYGMLKDRIARLANEHFVVIGLSARNWVKGIRIVTVGSTSECNITIPMVVKAVLEMDAISFAVAHNHPSGDPSPSREDLKITGDLIVAARVMGMTMQDHVIIGRHLPSSAHPYCSIRETGLVLFD